MALTTEFLESFGFVITEDQGVKQARKGTLVIMKWGPNEEWTIDISDNVASSNEFWLTDNEQVINLIQALNNPKCS